MPLLMTFVISPSAALTRNSEDQGDWKEAANRLKSNAMFNRCKVNIDSRRMKILTHLEWKNGPQKTKVIGKKQPTNLR
jgi:hypothetical protein